MSLSETTATWSKRKKKESATTIVKISLKLPLKREVGVDGEGNKELFKGCDKLFKGSLLRGKKGGEASPYQYYLLPIFLYLSPASASCFISAPTSISADRIKWQEEDKSKSWDCISALYWSILTLAEKFTFKEAQLRVIYHHFDNNHP